MGNLALNFVNHSVLHIDYGRNDYKYSDYEDPDFLLNDNELPINIKFSWLKNLNFSLSCTQKSQISENKPQKYCRCQYL